MDEFSDEEIAEEAYRLWELEGRPLWSHAYDHWLRAVESLRLKRASGLPAGSASETLTKGAERS